MAEKKPIVEREDTEDAFTVELRGLRLERPDALLRQRVLADVDDVLRRPVPARRISRPWLAIAALAGALFLLIWVPWDGSSRHPASPQVPTAYIEDTAQWLDLSPELARHVVRPLGAPTASTYASSNEGRLHDDLHAAIDL